MEDNVTNSYILITFYVSHFIVCSTPNYNATRNNWWEIGWFLFIQTINSSHQLLIINFFTDLDGIKIFVFLRTLL
jgi:hypothetical protein